MMQFCRIGLTILDQELEQIKPDKEGVVHARNSIMDHIAGFKVWREWPT
jgi:hypothetical protein